MDNPWLSLGGHFDYAKWKDRERFLELDKAIASAPISPNDRRGLLEVELLIGKHRDWLAAQG